MTPETGNDSQVVIIQISQNDLQMIEAMKTIFKAVAQLLSGIDPKMLPTPPVQ